MLVIVALGFPVLLLLGVLAMERVEHRLSVRPAADAGHPADSPSTTR